MSSETLSKDWLDPASLKSAAARRFAEFCLQSSSTTDSMQETGSEADDPVVYRQAVALILERLEQGSSNKGAA